MKTNTAHQEVLLITGTSFSSRQCFGENTDQTSEREKLQEACWNGLLQEMLPEIFTQHDKGKNLFLWTITETNSFLELELSESPEAKDRYFSIDPYSFLSLQSYS
jgi:hypothetical protein